MRVFYEVYGIGGADVLLLPTWSIIHSRQWKAQIPYLARHFRVVTFDGRGNGRSDRPSESAAYDEREFARTRSPCWTRRRPTAPSIVGLLARSAARADPRRRASRARRGRGLHRPGLLGRRRAARRARALPWEDELDTDEGWAKYNRHYWLRDYRGFVEFFFAQMFREPHSTKQIEDCVGWGLETSAGDADRRAVRRSSRQPEEARELARRVRCPVLVRPRRSRTRSRHYTRGARSPSTRAATLVLLEGGGHAPHARGSRHVQPARARVRAEARVILAVGTTASRPAPATPTRRASSSATACASSTRSTAIGRTDVPAAADVVDHPLAALEDADPVPRAALPVVTFDGRGNGRSDRPPGAEAYASASSRADALAVHGRDGDGTRCPRRRARAAALWASCSPPSIRSASPAPSSSAPAVPLGASRSRARRLRLRGASSTPTRAGRSTTCTTGCATTGTSSSSSSGSCFTEPHSTKQIEDCVGWALETTPESCSRHHDAGIDLPTGGDFRELCAARSLPGARPPRRRGRAPLARARRGARRGRRAGELVTLAGLRPLSAGARPGDGQPARSRVRASGCRDRRSRHTRAVPCPLPRRGGLRRARRRARLLRGLRDAPTTFLLFPPSPISHSRLWKAQVPYLSRHFRVVTFDPRGQRPLRPSERRRGLRLVGVRRRRLGPCWRQAAPDARCSAASATAAAGR